MCAETRPTSYTCAALSAAYSWQRSMAFSNRLRAPSAVIPASVSPSSVMHRRSSNVIPALARVVVYLWSRMCFREDSRSLDVSRRKSSVSTEYLHRMRMHINVLSTCISEGKEQLTVSNGLAKLKMIQPKRHMSFLYLRVHTVSSGSLDALFHHSGMHEESSSLSWPRRCGTICLVDEWSIHIYNASSGNSLMLRDRC